MPDSHWIGLTIERLEKLLFDSVASDVLSPDVKRALDNERTRLIDNFMAQVEREKQEKAA